MTLSSRPGPDGCEGAGVWIAEKGLARDEHPTTYAPSFRLGGNLRSDSSLSLRLRLLPVNSCMMSRNILRCFFRPSSIAFSIHLTADALADAVAGRQPELVANETWQDTYIGFGPKWTCARCPRPDAIFIDGGGPGGGVVDPSESSLPLPNFGSSRGFRGGKLCSRPPCPNAEGVFVRRKLAIGNHVVLIERRPLTTSFDSAHVWP